MELKHTTTTSVIFQ